MYRKHIKRSERRRCQCVGSQWWRCWVRGGSTLSWHWEWRSVLHVRSLDADSRRRSCSCLFSRLSFSTTALLDSTRRPDPLTFTLWITLILPFLLFSSFDFMETFCSALDEWNCKRSNWRGTSGYAPPQTKLAGNLFRRKYLHHFWLMRFSHKKHMH